MSSEIGGSVYVYLKVSQTIDTIHRNKWGVKFLCFCLLLDFCGRFGPSECCWERRLLLQGGPPWPSDTISIESNGISNRSNRNSQKFSKRRKIARMARILTIFGRNRSSRRNLSFQKFSNEQKIIEWIDWIGRSIDQSYQSMTALGTENGEDGIRYGSPVCGLHWSFASRILVASLPTRCSLMPTSLSANLLSNAGSEI